jgi:Domain of unknown function (DUF4189)
MTSEESSESGEVPQPAADTSHWARPETEIIENIHHTPTQAAELAWSTDDGTVDYDAAGPRQSRHDIIMRVGVVGAVIAAAMVAGGGVWMWDHQHTAPTAAASAAAPNGPVLDGIYEIASDNQHRTVNGVSRPGTDLARYWAFRSLCTPARCVATAAEVSDTNHQVANFDHDHSVWLWVFGTWKENPDHNTSPCSNGRDATATMVRTLAPQADGTLKGTETDVVDRGSMCAAGEVLKHSITAKRIGDTPKDLVADPVTAPLDLGVHVNQYVAVAVSRGAARKSAFQGTGDTADYASAIAVTECVEGTSANDCVLVETNLNGCVSLAVDADGNFVGGKGPDMASARADARAKLPSSYWTSEGPCSS